MVLDSRSLTTVVWRQAETALVLVSDHNITDNTIITRLPCTLTLECSGERGRPGVSGIQWLNTDQWDSVNTSQPETRASDVRCDPRWPCNDLYQRINVTSSTSGDFSLSCKTIQRGYVPQTKTFSIRIVEDDPDNDDDTESQGSKLHTFTIVLIVLGCVAVVIIVVCLCCAWFTNTICFTREEDQYTTDDAGVVDTHYVVGQDYKPRHS